MTAVQSLLLEWLAWLFALGVVLASYAAVYVIGRAHGRQAQRKATVRTVVEDLIAETIVIPRPRQDVES